MVLVMKGVIDVLIVLVGLVVDNVFIWWDYWYDLCVWYCGVVVVLLGEYVGVIVEWLDVCFD